MESLGKTWKDVEKKIKAYEERTQQNEKHSLASFFLFFHWFCCVFYCFPLGFVRFFEVVVVVAPQAFLCFSCSLCVARFCSTFGLFFRSFCR